MHNTAKTLRFELRPAPVMPEHRPLYKIGQLLLVLTIASRGGKSSLPRLQLFNWAFKKKEWQARVAAAKNDGTLKVSAWGFDPAVPVAISFAIAEGLIETNPTGYNASSAGEKFISEICKDNDCFSLERSFLSQIGKAITEDMVSRVAKNWENE